MRDMDALESEVNKMRTKFNKESVEKARASNSSSVDSSASITPEDLQEFSTAEPSTKPEPPDINFYTAAKIPSKARALLEYIAHPEVNGVHNVKGMTSGAIDELVYRLRLQGVSISEISSRLRISTEETTSRMTAMIQVNQAGFTDTEYRHIQIARLEGIINMLWNWASAGNIEHADLLVKSIERLNKIFSLEHERATIEVNIVSKAQTELIIKAVNAATLEVIKQTGIELDSSTLNNIIAGALDQASDIVEERASSPVVIDQKGNVIAERAS